MLHKWATGTPKGRLGFKINKNTQLTISNNFHGLKGIITIVRISERKEHRLEKMNYISRECLCANLAYIRGFKDANKYQFFINSCRYSFEDFILYILGIEFDV